MSNSVHKRIPLDHSIEKVWKTLVESDSISRWWMETDFKPEQGTRFTFKEKANTWRGEIINIQEPINLAMSWENPKGSHNTYIWWKLSETNGGTLLELEHSGFRGIRGFFASLSQRGKWNSRISRLRQLLATE